MSAPIVIDGKALAEKYLIAIKNEIATKKITPKLAIIMVGDNPASAIYIKNKESKATFVGINTKLFHLPTETSENDLIALVKKLGKSRTHHGILVQFPLPAHIDSTKVVAAINPLKDVDGFTTENIGKLALKQDCLIPCTPQGCLHLIKSVSPNIDGLNAVIIGRSQIVGRPLSQLLLNENCTVTITHRHTKNLKKICQTADILVAACGNPKMVKADWIKQGSIIIDVGITRLETGKISGDVDFTAIVEAETAKAITPVPGGVGPMTIAMLMSNTLKAYKLQNNFI